MFGGAIEPDGGDLEEGNEKGEECQSQKGVGLRSRVSEESGVVDDAGEKDEDGCEHGGK